MSSSKTRDLPEIKWSGDIDLFADTIRLHRDIKELIFRHEYLDSKRSDIEDLKDTEKFLCEREKVMIESFLLVGQITTNEDGSGYLIR